MRMCKNNKNKLKIENLVLRHVVMDAFLKVDFVASKSKHAAGFLIVYSQDKIILVPINLPFSRYKRRSWNPI